VKWLWPFSWYFGMKTAQAAAAHWKSEAERWEGVARAAAVAQCGMTAAYVAAIASLSSSLSAAPRSAKSGCRSFQARDRLGYCRHCGYHHLEH
jgi:hypothetical protein